MSESAKIEVVAKDVNPNVAHFNFLTANGTTDKGSDFWFYATDTKLYLSMGNRKQCIELNGLVEQWAVNLERELADA